MLPAHLLKFLKRITHGATVAAALRDRQPRQLLRRRLAVGRLDLDEQAVRAVRAWLEDDEVWHATLERACQRREARTVHSRHDGAAEQGSRGGAHREP